MSNREATNDSTDVIQPDDLARRLHRRRGEAVESTADGTGPFRPDDVAGVLDLAGALGSSAAVAML